MSEAAFDTDVLVIGTGPSGATTALVLAKHGVRVHMVSMWNWLAHTPRAHITNQRTNEVFRDLGLDEEIARYASPWDVMGDMTFATSLVGDELVRLRSWGTGDDRKGDYMRASPCGMVDIIQPKLEPILLKSAAEHGVSFSFNTQYLSHEQCDDGVRVRLKDKLSDSEYEVRARYLVGADGANSTIFKQLGLELHGQMARAGTVYVQFKADLSALMAHHPSIISFIVSPDASFGEIGLGLLRAVTPWTEWILGWGFDITEGEPNLSEDHLRQRVLTLIGDPTIKIEDIRPSTWYVNEAYATEFSRGRVFCAGDAVHRHPPTSGLGMNTCIQDAVNLGWKLAYVIKGYAGADLLDTYTPERAPVGKQIVQRANQSRRDYAALNACFRVPGAENPVLAGIARLRDPGKDGVAVRKAIKDALALMANQFNGQGIEMNQRYASNAVIEEDGLEPEVFARDELLYCQPTTRPGAKIPHAWLVNRAGRQISTLDVVGKGRFTLLTGIAGTAWVEAVQRLNLPFLSVVVIGSKDAQDLYWEWARVRGVEEAGAILIRPDGYVAWRESDTVEDPDFATETLSAAMAKILSRPVATAPQSADAVAAPG